MEKTSDILNRAAEVMMERGHCKEALNGDNGEVCLAGSLLAVLDETEYSFGRFIKAKRFVAEACGERYIETWNDRTETTEAMAIGALHEAALLAKSEGD